MSSVTTTSLLLPSYSGHFLAEVVSADPTATTFVLDCDWDKYPWKGEDDCYVTKQTVVVGPWADKTPAPGAPTTGIYKESYVDQGTEEGEEGYFFSAECKMSKTSAGACTGIKISGNAYSGPTATFPPSTGTALDGFYFFKGYGAFSWIAVTVTAGEKYLSAAKTAVAASIEASVTSDAQLAKATTGNDEAISTVDEDIVILTGEASQASTVDGDVVILTGKASQTSTGDEDVVILTGEASQTSTGDEDIVIVTGEASPTETSTSSGACAKRVLSVWGLVGLVAAVCLL